MEQLINLKHDVRKQMIAEMKKHNVQGILLHSTVNRLWLSKFPSSEGYLLVTPTVNILYLDGRYITDGTKRAKNVDFVKQMPTNSIGGTMQMIKDDLAKYNVQVLGIESEYTVYAQYEMLVQSLAPINIQPINLSEIRVLKDNDEANKILKACAIADKAFMNVLETIKPGMKEKEVEEIIVSTFIREGAEKPSFDTIVASGVRGALPHGAASEKVINEGELVTIDFGCIFEGYCSDTTRTISVGQPPKKLAEIYAIVAEAQALGLAAVRPGIKTTEIDKICRDYITEKGYGEYFTHSTGHGLGIEVHEYPRVSPFCDEVLQPGMVITVEPGIYIPDLGGVRIEDDILVTPEGGIVLSRAPKQGTQVIVVNN